MSAECIIARYLIETTLAVESAAEVIAGEQSSGTFVPVPGETEELKKRARAQVVAIDLRESVPNPSLPGARPPQKGYQRAEITIAFPLGNLGPNLPTLLSTVAGNLFELSEVSGLKLIDLELPAAFAERYPGPQFGIEGTRKLSGVVGRPLIGTIVKPSVGLTPKQTAAIVRNLGEAGIDFIKDDELMANPPHSPLSERVRAVMDEVKTLAEKTGRKLMYAFNISDDLDAMLAHHDLVRAEGGTCIMVSLNSIGLAALATLRKHAELPIHGHRNGWGLICRHPLLGISFSVYQKLWRLAGADHLHVNGLRNKFWEPDDSVVQSIQACLTPMFGGYVAMPVVSSGQWAAQAPETFRRAKTMDLIFLAGGGIMAHPGGPSAGLRSIQQAWEAAGAGIDLQTYAACHPELAAALERFANR